MYLQNPALGHAATEFVSVPSGVLTGVTDYSIAFWVKLDQNQGWQRIYDFGNGKGGADTRFAYFTPLGFLPSPEVGLMADVFTAAGGSGGTTPTTTSSTRQTQFPLGVWKHVAITSQAGVETDLHRRLPGRDAVTGDRVPASDLEPLAGNAWLGRSRFDFSATSSPTSDPGLDGTIDDFEIFDKVADCGRDRDASSRCRRRTTRTGGSTRPPGPGDQSVRQPRTPRRCENGATWDSDARLGGAVQLPGGAAGATGPTVELAKNPLADCTAPAHDRGVGQARAR